MKPAVTHSGPWSASRLLVVRGKGSLSVVEHRGLSVLPEYFRAGDLLVLNDAATVPASFQGVHQRSGRKIELRLASAESPDPAEPRQWSAIFFGEGDWRTPTEKRRAPPGLEPEDLIEFEGGLRAWITQTVSPRLARIEFLPPRGATLWQAIYRAGRPVQYSYLREELELWDVQTGFAGAPVSLEAPSAAFGLSWELLLKLKARGVRIATLTHAAGLSTTGDEVLDRSLPLPERYWIPESTAAAIARARRDGHRVIAVGTSVTRALEASAIAHEGQVRPGSRIATLKITPAMPRQVVQGILSGFHDSGASHLELLGSFVAPTILRSAYETAERRGYLAHEFGDRFLALPD